MRSYPDILYKTHGESTDYENLIQLVFYEKNANSVGTVTELVI